MIASPNLSAGLYSVAPGRWSAEQKKLRHPGSLASAGTGEQARPDAPAIAPVGLSCSPDPEMECETPRDDGAGLMAIDLVLRGGTVVDGTGAAPRLADVAVDGGLIKVRDRLLASAPCVPL